MTTGTIWIAKPEKLENQHDFTVAPGATKEAKLPFIPERRRMVKAWEKTLRGERLNAADVPRQLIHFKRGRVPFTGPVPAVIANAGVFLRPDVVTVLEEFDLGAAQFFPVELHDTVPDNPIGTTLHFINPVNVKRTVDADLSGLTRARIGTMVLTYYDPPDVQTRHRTIRTFSDALRGPDLWIDLMFPRVMFVSERLASRLVAQGWQRVFDLYPTTLIV